MGSTLNGQRLSDISDLTLRLEDAGGNFIEMQMVVNVTEALNTPHEAVYDRKSIKGMAKVNPEPAEITIEGHYVGFKTRSDGTGEQPNPIEFMRGQHAGAVGTPNITGDFTFDLKITETDRSTNPLNQQLLYSCCVLESINKTHEPGTNKISVTLKSADEFPTVTEV